MLSRLHGSSHSCATWAVQSKQSSSTWNRLLQRAWGTSRPCRIWLKSIVMPSTRRVSPMLFSSTLYGRRCFCSTYIHFPVLPESRVLSLSSMTLTICRCIKREPHLLSTQHRPEWVGISGGILSLSALAVAHDFDSLYDACLWVGGLICRICRFCYIRSRATDDCPGTWGWAVLGISTDTLRVELDQFQNIVVSTSTSSWRSGQLYVNLNISS